MAEEMKVKITYEDGYAEYFCVPKNIGNAVMSILDTWETMQNRIDELESGKDSEE